MRAILRPRGIAIMSRLAIVDTPTVHCVGKGFLYVKRRGSADSDFNEVAFIDENLEIVLCACCENFSADDSLESAAFFGGTD